MLFIVDLGEGHNRCGHHGPDIRFPFRLKDRQPDQQCGYPGFDLYCSDEHETVLELPTSVKVFVKRIDYQSQLIQVTNSDNCFPLKIRGLNLSSSPFQFKTENFLEDYALFNCTSETDIPYPRINCLSSFSTSVYAFLSDNYIDEFPIISCTKMYSVSSVPSDIWDFTFLELTWSEPKCRDCEVKGEKCRFKNNSTDFNIECFNPYGNKGRLTKIVATGELSIGHL
nr:putative ring-h2 finger protein atl21b [Quercus suber]